VAGLLLLAQPAFAVEPGEILPRNIKYEKSIPAPLDYFGFPVGQRHLHHHELVGYLQSLAGVSDRVTIQEYGRTYGGRPLVMLCVTAAENHQRLEAIRTDHLQLADAASSAATDLDGLPAVVYLGYSVHGNEPSGGNVAPLVAYYLAAGNSDLHRRLLKETVILLDPCINPDGFDRFAQWATDHRGSVPNPDPAHREHQEAWPSGRTNYYWFDLNRDWLPAQHPETRGRLAVYHRWKPNVVLDFHEMSTNATYFFQPGVPERNHPLTPEGTFDLTRKIAKFNAAALDRAGALYFTQERFDDFYMGKGSTYPDLQGAVGILYEQASSRGQKQQSPNGTVTFPFTIRNQFLTTVSSLRATLAMRRELLEHQRTFYHDAQALARNAESRAFVVAAGADPMRLRHFLMVLDAHNIQTFQLAKDVTLDGETFRENEAYVIPCEQAEYRFLESLLETRTEFAENVFYDVSTWTLPLAFNLQFATVENALPARLLGKPFRAGADQKRPAEPPANALAYLVDWRGCYAPRTLYRLLDADVLVKVARQPIALEQGGRRTSLGCGSLLIPLGVQPEKRSDVRRILSLAADDGVAVHATNTGLTPDGMDLGSSGFRVIPKPKVILVTGDGVSTNQAGEVWHLLDRRVSMPVTLVDARRLAGIQLQEYTAIVLAGGSYRSINESAVRRLQSFLDQGGTLIAIGTAARWVGDAKVVEVTFRENTAKENDKTTSVLKRRPYAEASRDAAEKLVQGSIFLAHVDATHPVCYGYRESASLPVFRDNRVFLELSKNPYSSPVVYDTAPLLSGYISEANLEKLAGSASAVVYRRGEGRVVLLVDNPNFRAFWFGTNRLFLNSLFFGPIIRVP